MTISRRAETSRAIAEALSEVALHSASFSFVFPAVQNDVPIALLGLQKRLDYIQGMGFDAVWISPIISNTPGGYHGYWAQVAHALQAFPTGSEITL